MGGSSAHFEDLTAHSSPCSPTSPNRVRVLTVSHVRVLTKNSCFDMSSTDSDDAWTFSPEIEQNSCHADSDDLCPFSLGFEQHLRAVSQLDTYFDATTLQDVILDSGADTSALPLRFAHVGDECPSANTCYVDAQGAPLTIESTRVANVQFGDVTFRERFIVSDVTFMSFACFGFRASFRLGFGAF